MTGINYQTELCRAALLILQNCNASMPAICVLNKEEPRLRSLSIDGSRFWSDREREEGGRALSSLFLCSATERRDVRICVAN